MKKEDLMDALNNLDDDLLLEATKKPKKGGLISFVRIAAPIAAAVLLIGLLIPVINGNMNSKNKNASSDIHENFNDKSDNINENDAAKEEDKTSSGIKNETVEEKGPSDTMNIGPAEEVEKEQSSSSVNHEIFGTQWHNYGADGSVSGNKLASSMLDFMKNTNAQIYSANQANNYLYSPFSLYMALMYSADLANDGSASDVYKALGYASHEEMLDSLKTIFGSMTKDGKYGVFTTNSSLWLDEIKVTKDIREKLEKVNNRFRGTSVNIDLQSAEATREINAWMEKATRGLIKNKISGIDAETEVLLYNAIYFNGAWAKDILKNQVYPGDFTTSAGAKISVPMIHTAEETTYLTSAHASAAKLNYKDGSYMLFVRPGEGESLDTVMREDVVDVVRMCQEGEGKKATVRFTFPKFKAEAKLDGIDTVVKNVGINSIFDNNYSGIGLNIGISGINQFTAIVVDEKGTEAAAVTQMYGNGSAMVEPSEIIDMTLDREYAYVIMSAENIPLFVGTVNNPLN